MTLLQRATGEGNRGRVFGALSAVEGVAVVAGTLAAGLLGQATGIIGVLAAQGAGYVLAGFAVLAALHGRAGAAPPAAAQPAGAPADADASLATSVSTSYWATEAPS
jgi:hypothetical protein